MVENLLLGRDGCLPSCTRILGGFREDSLRGVGKLTRCTSQQEGIFSSRGGRAFACKESVRPHTVEDKKGGKGAIPTEGHHAACMLKLLSLLLK